MLCYDTMISFLIINKVYQWNYTISKIHVITLCAEVNRLRLSLSSRIMLSRVPGGDGIKTKYRISNLHVHEAGSKISI